MAGCLDDVVLAVTDDRGCDVRVRRVPGAGAGFACRRCRAGVRRGREAGRGAAGPAEPRALAAPGAGGGGAGSGRSCGGASGTAVSSAGGRGQRRDRSAWRFCAPVLVLMPSAAAICCQVTPPCRAAWMRSSSARSIEAAAARAAASPASAAVASAAAWVAPGSCSRSGASSSRPGGAAWLSARRSIVSSDGGHESAMAWQVRYPAVSGRLRPQVRGAGIPVGRMSSPTGHPLPAAGARAAVSHGGPRVDRGLAAGLRRTGSRWRRR